MKWLGAKESSGAYWLSGGLLPWQMSYDLEAKSKLRDEESQTIMHIPLASMLLLPVRAPMVLFQRPTARSLVPPNVGSQYIAQSYTEGRVH